MSAAVPTTDPLEGNDRYRTIKHLNQGEQGLGVLSF